MKQQSIINPKTGKSVKVVTWGVDSKALMDKMKAAPKDKPMSAKDVSWLYLADDRSVQHMQDTEHGDSLDNNFALRVFEQGLDWTIGLAVLGFIRLYLKQHRKLIKHFTIAIDRKGDAYILYGDTVIRWSE